MTTLGNKHECSSCGTKFYDLGKSKIVCPSCGKDQAEAEDEASAKPSAPARRKKAAKAKKPAKEVKDDSEPTTPVEATAKGKT